MKKIKLKISGIHCKSCKTLIEEEINLIPGVKSIDVNLASGKAQIIFDEGEAEQDKIVKTIESLNYEAEIIKVYKPKKQNLAKKQPEKISKNLFAAGAVLILFALIYFFISRLGLFETLAKLNDKNLSYGLIFVIGLLASFHCIGMCGGIVMAYTTRFCASVKGNKIISTPHINYNLGRIIAYALTGAFLGGLGSFIGINKIFTGTLTLLAGLFMIAVGISLITRLSILDKITSILPVTFTRLFSSQIHSIKPKAPFIIGFLNGFIPCGPLQAMQIYSLASGSALAGGLSMASFGLGTVPLMLGFGNIIAILSQSRLKQILKVSGVIVILLGILNVSRSFAIFNSSQSSQPIDIHDSENVINENKNQTVAYQEAKMDLTYKGYEPSTLTVKKDIPVRWIINAKEISGCTREILLPAFGVDKQLKSGKNIIEFTPKVAGTYKFSCGMRMVWGKFVVTD